MSTLSTKYRKLLNLVKEKTKPRITACFVGQGSHAVANLYPSLVYSGIELLATCATHNADYTSYLKMMDEVKMDALIVCVNAQMHYEIAMEAVKRKLPVFIEKPPAPNSYCAKQLMEQAEIFVMVGFNKRFSPVYREAKRLIPKPISMTINVNVGKCKTREELFYEVGIHYVDLFRWFGVDGPFSISDKLSWEKATEHIEILGEGKLAVIDNGQLIYHTQDKEILFTPNRVVPCKENHLIFTNGYVYELEHFADCVANKKPFSPDMKDGYEALRRIEEML